MDRFVHDHENGEVPAQARYYRNLIPLARPQPGQQYAFEVDLDRCSSCKACVSACHSLNGLDDGETWRETGLLLNQDWTEPFQQTVTTACHHCLDPACLTGCPVLAYDKDPMTGIVRHLDDQCIGCQYCVMKCPYDVPKYSARRGIVRKCDMCASRLAASEAPACVQACPTEAIRIVIADKSAITAAAHRGEFLPAAPSPDYTLPATRYKSKKRFPEGLIAADHADLKPSDPHTPLVFMLVLSQLAVGTSIAAAFDEPSGLLTAIAAFAGFLALATAALHLGKPLKAWRAFLGWRTSWFSREVIAFGIFVPLATATLLPMFSVLKAVVALAGTAGVACSAMIYADTRREFWRASQSFGKFFTTTLLLGAAAIFGVQTFARVETIFLLAAPALVMAATFAKLAIERCAAAGPFDKSARLLAGELRSIARIRMSCAVTGGVVLPMLDILAVFLGSSSYGVMAGMALITFLVCVGGELLERYLFFTAVVPERMPGRIVA